MTLIIISNKKWAQIKIMKLLNEQAAILEREVVEYDNSGKEKKTKNNYNPYDGLIVSISCHGIKNYIVSSDYYKIDKTIIHRIFSQNHPKCREIFRLFVGLLR